MPYYHKRPKLKPIKITSVNGTKGNELNDLEAALLCFQKLIEGKVKEGKKGIVLFKDTDSEYKMSYKKLQSLLWELNTLFGMKGAFSFGICETCSRFENSCSDNGAFGKCKGADKHMFDSCEEHKGDGGFGKNN